MTLRGVFQVYNATRDVELAVQAIMADTFWSRLKGLWGKKTLPPGEGLIIQPCSSVHSFFMKFSIDVIFVDKDGIVVGMVQHLQPSRITPIFRKAFRVIELPAGTIADKGTSVGDKLIFREG